MTATEALVPLNGILPLPVKPDTSLWTPLNHTPDRSAGRLIAAVYSPDRSDLTYGPDGTEISFQEKGKRVDCYA